jgi:hypothetical protein
MTIPTTEQEDLGADSKAQTSTPGAPSAPQEPLTIDEAWLELCEKSDRDSGHPDMCLITREELAEFMGHSEWHDINTAPKDGRDILAAEPGVGAPPRICFWDEARGGIWSMWPGRERMYPTRWRYVPEPPK